MSKYSYSAFSTSEIEMTKDGVVVGDFEISTGTTGWIFGPSSGLDYLTENDINEISKKLSELNRNRT